MNTKDINNWNNNFNQDNLVGYEARSQPEYRKQADADKSFDTINKLDWNKEAKYHNITHGRNNYIKSKNFDLAMANCMSKRSNEPEGTILNPDSHPADWVLSDIGKEYYKGEIKRTNSLLLSLAEDKDNG